MAIFTTIFSSRPLVTAPDAGPGVAVVVPSVPDIALRAVGDPVGTAGRGTAATGGPGTAAVDAVEEGGDEAELK